ncbi:MAG TPA: DUF6588 family protein [Bacteroidales bacterium]|nr:DUF6588 family protein [Bacteroidales bacterium]
MTKQLRATMFAVCAVFSLFPVSAQMSGIGSLLSGSTKDGELIMQEYLKPYANAFGTNMNGGWYNTAKNHKLLGFDLTFSVSTTFIPKADKEFDASTLGLSVGKNNISAGMSPTIAGSKTAGQTISYDIAGRSLSYQLPKGTNWGVIPSPMIQLGIGLVKETDLMFRFVPSMNVGDYGKFGLWGIGAKHSIKQYIPGIKMAPFFHLSVFLGYTKMKTTSDISIQPQFYDDFMSPAPTKAPGNYDNQQMEMTINGFTGSAIASFDLPVVTFYGSLGFSNTSAKISMNGNYPLPTVNGTNVTINPVADPVSFKISNSSGMKPRLNAGIKFKMAVITWHVDYTYAKYSVLTTGLGLSFR